jgi:hypothetical protein
MPGLSRGRSIPRTVRCRGAKRTRAGRPWDCWRHTLNVRLSTMFQGWLLGLWPGRHVGRDCRHFQGWPVMIVTTATAFPEVILGSIVPVRPESGRGPAIVATTWPATLGVGAEKRRLRHHVSAGPLPARPPRHWAGHKPAGKPLCRMVGSESWRPESRQSRSEIRDGSDACDGFPGAYSGRGTRRRSELHTWARAAPAGM